MSVLLRRRSTRHRASGGGLTETWTGADGASWPADWTVNPSGGGTLATNRGRLTADPSGYASAWWGGKPAQADFDVTVTFKGAGGEAYVGVGAAATAWYVPDNGHVVKFEIASSSALGYAVLQQRKAGATTEITFEFAGTSAGANGWTARVKRVGNTITAKVWTAGATEPAPWLLSGTDPSPYSYTNDRVWLGYAGSGSTTLDFDDLTLT